MQASAITLNSKTYSLDEYGSVSIIVSPPATDGIVYIYDTATGILSVFFERYSEGDDLNYNRLIPGNYSAVELSPSFGDAWVCNLPGEELLYEDCKALSGFASEFKFKIKYGSYEYGGGVDAKPVFSYAPQIELSSPNSKNTYSHNIPIIYRSSDQNDTLTAASKDSFGLGEGPVSLYFTDKFTREYELDNTDNDKVLIKKELPPVGSYDWDSTNLIEQKFYQVIARVIDKAGVISQTITDLFSVDLTPPTFIVTANPSVAKSEKVTISIKSSEKLINTPIVSVLQRGALPVYLKVTGDLTSYEATYDTVDGFDGTAIINVSGKDMAGNTGNIIVGGGTFSVGINPPSKPTIISPSNNAKITTETIDITGSGRDDTIVSVTVNGVDKYTTKPDSLGNFVIKNVRLNKKNINGKNVLNITAKDILGSVSDGLVLNVYSNDNPEVKINLPLDKSLLNGMSTISASATDGNGDKINYKYEIALKDKNTSTLNWQYIENVPSDKITFNTTKFVDGEYYIRVTADDGLSNAESNMVSVSIKNETSFFIRFYDGYRTIVNSPKATIRGVIFADKSVYPIPNIKSLSYSKDGGANWIKVDALDGSFDSKEERFSIDILDLKQGVNHTLWHSVDSKGKFYDTEQMVVVDNIAPVTPEIITPDLNVTLTKIDNDLTNTIKFNFTLSGNSESDSNVVVEVAGKTYSTRTAYDGTFRIKGINLPNVGKYDLKIFAIDSAKNKSQVLVRTITYNNPPIIVFTSPREGRGVGIHTDISWLVNDIDKDSIRSTTLSYHQIGSPFTRLVENPPINKYSWDTSGLLGNNFEIKLEVSDSFSKSTSIIPFSIDHNIPILNTFILNSDVMTKGGVIEGSGTASDSDSGVEFVEYSFRPIDDISEKEPIWYKANLDKKSVNGIYSYKINNKVSLSDGEYQVSVRAIDNASNHSENKYSNFIVDTTAPHVGSLEIYSQNIKLLPQNSVWRVIKGVVNLKVSLEKDTKEASMYMDNTKIPLSHDFATGLWMADLDLENIGDTSVSISLIDILGNHIENLPFINFDVVDSGTVTYIDSNGSSVKVSGATISAKVINESKSFWSIFKPSKKYKAVTDNNGGYSLLLPAGKYDISIDKEGFNKLNIGNVSLDNTTYINKNSVIDKNTKGSIWSNFIHMLQFN